MKSIITSLLLLFGAVAFSQSITVTYPNTTTDTLQAGAVNTIKWRTQGISSGGTILRYSLDGGLNFLYMAYRSVNDSTFSWTPQQYQVSDKLIIQVSTAQGDIFDKGDALSVLKIGTGVGLAAPQNTNFLVGNTYGVDLRAGGSISYVDLAYSKDYSPYITIADSIPANTIYNWTIPTDSAHTVILKVSESGNPSNSSTYYNYSISTLPQSFTVTYPNGGEVLTEGALDTIRWTATANLTGAQCYFDYSLDSGNTWRNIGDQNAEVGKHAWTIPLHVSSTNCLVRVRLSNLITVADTSDAPFTIALGPPSITLQYPRGGEKFLAGSNTYLNYRTTGTLDSLNAGYSTDGGATYTVFQTGFDPLQSGGSITIPDVQSANAYFKLEDSGNTNVMGTSDSAFTITKVYISQPSQFGNTTYFQGTTNDIIWGSSTSVGDTLRISLSVDDGATWRILSDSVYNGSSKNFNWTIPNDSSSLCRIKIEDVSDPTHQDISAIPFSIMPSPFTITAPNGGEYVPSNSQYTITWNTASPVFSVRLEYSSNGGITWNNINSNVFNIGTYTWYTPGLAGSNYKIRVSSRNQPSVFDVSDTTFNVGLVAPTGITVTSPNGGENLPWGSTHTITWNSSGTVDSVDIYVSYNNGASYLKLADNEANDGSYQWQLPAFQIVNSLVKIEVAGNNSVKDSSDAVFEVNSQIQLLKPNGGNTIGANSTYKIDWNSFGSFYGLSLDYSLDSGATWTNIISGQNDTGSYNWNVPNVNTTNALIAVKAFDNGLQRADTSNAVFTIQIPPASISLTHPNGGEILNGNTNDTIRWTSTGTVGSLELYYSINNGASWIFYDDNISNSGTYGWVVPNVSSTNCLVTLRFNGSPALISDTSAAVFSINAAPLNTVTLTAPAPNDTLETERFYAIDWTTSGTVGALDLFYSTDGGSNWTNIATNVTTAPYQWFTPLIVSDSCLIRVSDGTIGDTTDDFFYLVPGLSNAVAVAKYTFDNGFATDEIGNYDGDRRGVTLINDRAGCANHAVELGFKRFLDMGDVMDNLFATPDTSFSISFWTDGSALGNSGTIFSKRSQTLCNENGNQFEIRQVNGSFHISAYYDLAGNNYTRIRTTQTNIAPNTWSHVVIVYDGSITSSGVDRFKVYVNNQLKPLVDSNSMGSLGDIPSGPARVGFGHNIKSDATACGQDYKTGYLDDVAIFGGKLSSFDVANLYNEVKTCPNAVLQIDSITPYGILSYTDTAMVYWTTTGSVLNVDISYCLDSGKTFVYAI